MRILIGYDGSRDAEAALNDLQWAGLPAKTRALVVTVTSPWTVESMKGLGRPRLEREAESIEREARKQAQPLADLAAIRLRATFPHWKVSAEAVVEHPAEGLLRRAETWKPDLMVLGCHGRTAFGRLLMGSVSLHVLNHASCDVRITRPHEASEAAPRVLIAVDGSAGSDHAVSAAAARHWPKGTRIQVIAALEGIGLTDALRGIKNAALGDHKDMRRTWVEQKSATAAKRLAAPGIQVTSAVKIGDPRIVVLREAKAWGADCIFLGSRGLVGIERFLLGSVSSAVAAHAPCTVEVIRKNRGKRKGRTTIRPQAIAMGNSL